MSKIKIFIIDNKENNLNSVKAMFEEDAGFEAASRLFTSDLKADDIAMDATRETFDVYLIDILLNNTPEEESSFEWDLISVRIAKKIVEKKSDKIAKKILFYTGSMIDIDEDRLKEELPGCGAMLLDMQFVWLNPQLSDEQYKENREYARSYYRTEVKKFLTGE